MKFSQPWVSICMENVFVQWFTEMLCSSSDFCCFVILCVSVVRLIVWIWVFQSRCGIKALYGTQWSAPCGFHCGISANPMRSVLSNRTITKSSLEWLCLKNTHKIRIDKNVFKLMMDSHSVITCITSTVLWSLCTYIYIDLNDCLCFRKDLANGWL